MKNQRSSTNWLIDATLFASFIILFFLELTGVELHQWLGLACGALALYHLMVHWEWVKAVSQRFFGRTTGQARLYYLVDAPILFGFAVILISGLVISNWLDLSLGSASSTWLDLHVVASEATLLLIVFKIAIHGRWITKTARQMLSRPDASPVLKPALQPVSARTTSTFVVSERRDFLKLMGVVSAAAALALIQVSIQAEAANTQSTSSSQGQNNVTVQSEGNTASCASRCRKGRSCTFPGNCHDYIDRDSDGRCDLGECG